MGTRGVRTRPDLTVPGLLGLTLVAAFLAMGIPEPGDSIPAVETRPTRSPDEFAVHSRVADAAPSGTPSNPRTVRGSVPPHTVESRLDALLVETTRLRHAAVIHGRALTDHTGAPLPGVTVELVAERGSAADRGAPVGAWSTRTDENGDYLFVVDRPEATARYELHMHGDGLARHGARLGRLRPDNIYRDPGSPLLEAVDRRFLALDEHGAPLPGIELAVEEPIEPLLGLATRRLESRRTWRSTDEHGELHLETVHPITRIVAARDPHDRVGLQLLRDAAPDGIEPGPEVLRLRKSMLGIHGRVLGPGGDPVGDLLLRIAPRDAESSDRSTRDAHPVRTDPQGRFAVWAFDRPTDARRSIVRLEARRPESEARFTPIGKPIALGSRDVMLHLSDEASASFFVTEEAARGGARITAFRQTVGDSDWQPCPVRGVEPDGSLRFDHDDSRPVRLCVLSDFEDRRRSALVSVRGDRTAPLRITPKPPLAVRVRCVDPRGNPMPSTLVHIASDTSRPDLDWHGPSVARADERGEVGFRLPADLFGLRLVAGRERGGPSIELESLAGDRLRASDDRPLELLVGTRTLQPIELRLSQHIDPSHLDCRVLIRRIGNQSASHWDERLEVSTDGRLGAPMLETGSGYAFGFGWLDRHGVLRAAETVFARIDGASNRPIVLDLSGFAPATLTIVVPEAQDRGPWLALDRPEGLQRLEGGVAVGSVLRPTSIDGPRWRFDDLVPGTYVPALHRPFTGRFELHSGQSVQAVLQAIPSTVELLLRDDQGRPLCGANVRVTRTVPVRHEGRLTSDRNGSVHLPTSLSGHLLLEATVGQAAYTAVFARTPQLEQATVLMTPSPR